MNKTASIVMMNNEFNVLLYLYLFHRMMEVMLCLHYLIWRHCTIELNPEKEKLKESTCVGTSPEKVSLFILSYYLYSSRKRCSTFL